MAIRDPRRAKLAISVGVVPLLGLAMAACSSNAGSSAGASGASAATLALEAPLSGPSAASGGQMKNGCTLAVDEYNKSRGSAPKVTLDVQDDASKPETGVSLMAKFQQEHAVAIIGGYNSPVVLAMMPKAASDQIPFLAQGIASDIKGPWVYHSVPVGPVQAAGAVKYLKKKGVSKAGVLTDTSSFGTSALPDITRAMKSNGVDSVATATFDVDASNMSPQVLKLTNAGAQGIILYTTGVPIARSMIAIHQAGANLPVVSNFTAADPAVVQVAGPSADGLVFESIVDPNKPAVKKLTDAYTKAFGGGDSSVPVYAAVTYDQCNIALQGVKNGAHDGPGMKKFLDTYKSSTLVSGASGSTLKYTADDHTGWQADSIVYSVYRGGKPVPCSSASSQC